MTEISGIVSQRKETLLSYRKGEGLTLGKLVSTPDREDLFGSDDPYESRSVIIDTIMSEQELSLIALANALNINAQRSDENLMNRRKNFLQEFQISMRTLTSREDEGALVAAYLLPRFITK